MVDADLSDVIAKLVRGKDEPVFFGATRFDIFDDFKQDVHLYAGIVRDATVYGGQAQHTGAWFCQVANIEFWTGLEYFASSWLSKKPNERTERLDDLPIFNSAQWRNFKSFANKKDFISSVKKCAKKETVLLRKYLQKVDKLNYEVPEEIKM